MKKILLTVFAGIMLLTSLNVCGQHLEKKQQKPSEVLENILAGIEKGKIPAQIYPPGLLEGLVKKAEEGDEPLQLHKESYKLSKLKKRGGVEIQRLFNPLTQKFRVIDLGSLPGDFNYSFAFGINNKGQVVGHSTVGIGYYHACLWSNGSIQDLGTLGGLYSYAFGIDDSGKILGASTISMQNNDQYPYFWQDGSSQIIETLGGGEPGYSMSNGMNNREELVGGGRVDGIYRAFKWSNISTQVLSTLGGTSRALGLNDNDQIVGYSNIPGIGDRICVWSNGVIQDLGEYGIAYDINNLGQIVGYKGSIHAFLYQNGVKYDLNDLVETNISPGWFLQQAHGINDKGQIVGEGSGPAGSIRAFLLDPLPEGWEEVIAEQPDSILYGALPDRMEGETNLVLITHGNNPDINWLRNLTNMVGQELQGTPGWRVASYEWEERANHPFNPGKSLSNAIEDGLKGGRKLATNGWEHIHMIGHSAGSGFIEYATRTITNISPNIVVHTTFLDSFVGYLKGQEEEYGASSDWSDSYFSKTIQPRTKSILPNTYSVDVTDLDQVTHGVPVFLDWLLDPCTETIADHGWPYRFYSNTVTGTVTSEYKGFGYPLSKEGGNYDIAKILYPKGSSTNLGVPPTCNDSILGRDMVEASVSPSAVPSYKIGTVLVNAGAIELRTASPSWISLALYLTNDADTVTFEAKYTTTNANPKGLLTSYWDTNILGQLDEEAVLPGLQRYTYRFPMSSANSTHMFGLRLDPLTNVSSSIIITNITYGLTGPREDFTLSVTTNTVGGKPIFELKGDAGFAYALEASTNLITWETIARLANTNGTVRFYDPSPNIYSQRFYRAVVPR